MVTPFAPPRTPLPPRLVLLAGIPPGGLTGNGFDPTIVAIILGSFVVILLPVFLLVLWKLRREKRDHELNVRTGVPADARVVLLEGQPGRDRYRLTLQVTPPAGDGDGQPFVAVLFAEVPQPFVPLVQVGATVPVRMASRTNIELTLPGR